MGLIIFLGLIISAPDFSPLIQRKPAPLVPVTPL